MPIIPQYNLTPPVRIDWQDGLHTHLQGRVVDLDTMEPISGPDGFCCFVDEATGEWKRYMRRNGKMVIGPDGRLVVESGKGRVKFFPFIGTEAEFKAFLLAWRIEIENEIEMIGEEESLEGWPCRAGFAPR